MWTKIVVESQLVEHVVNTIFLECKISYVDDRDNESKISKFGDVWGVLNGDFKHWLFTKPRKSAFREWKGDFS